MNKDTLCWDAFFPQELYSPSKPAVVPFFRSLKAGLIELLTSEL